MNALENWFCSTGYWQRVTQRKLLPWLLSDADAGDHLLELGSGPGAATDELRRRMPRVTSIEYSHAFAANLADRLTKTRSHSTPAVAVVQGDAAALPFANGSFSSVVAVLMLHHLQSADLQCRAFSEISRVLRPGGVLLGFEISDGWLQRAIHHHSTFVPVDAAGLPGVLAAAGFNRTVIDARFSGFRFRATRPA